MKHLTDEEMIEHAYGESEKPTALDRSLDRHLESCRECARNFAELKRDLADVDRIEAPARDALYGERVWMAVAPMLPAYAAFERSPWWRSFAALKALSYATAALLLASSAFYAGRVWEHEHDHGLDSNQGQPVARLDARPSPQTKQPIVVVVLDDHLDRSERFLVELKHADLDSSAMASPMRDEAKSLLAANKVCRKNAAQSNDLELTTALDHLDKLLADAANEPGGLNGAAISKLQDEMNAEGVLFEVRVLRSRAAHPDGSANEPSEGGTI